MNQLFFLLKSRTFVKWISILANSFQTFPIPIGTLQTL